MTQHTKLYILHVQCLQLQADVYCSNFMQLWIESAILMPTAATSICICLQHIGCFNSVTGVADFAATVNTYVCCYSMYLLHNNGLTLYCLAALASQEIHVCRVLSQVGKNLMQSAKKYDCIWQKLAVCHNKSIAPVAQGHIVLTRER